ncbi:L,D-transpeptidase [Pseudomonas sp. GX19020]|uniref:L,D-transpeptidase n=1 Tax=Pseudomonas sp. GX19020 TaxID=2942277 RepID=UPI0020191662|nr:L,D-transpeptidase [Pseudomonas sp. GX19020]
MIFTLPRLVAVLALSALAACGAKPHIAETPGVVAGYEAVDDGKIHIPAVAPKYLMEDHRRAEVAYNGDDAPGSIVVDVYSRKLYWVLPDGRAVRYAIAVGREGTSFRGNGYIGRKAEWPSWTPTANMIRTRPDLYAEYAGGLPGGLENPLGSRALYLYRGGRDTMFRIHGTIDNASVGLATSAGCIRLYNQDVMDLYTRAGNGTHVKVRSEAESVALEGPYMDDAFGRAVPETEANIAKKAADEAAIAKAEADARVAAEKAEAKRLKQCKRKKIAPEDCPLPETEATAG